MVLNNLHNSTQGNKEENLRCPYALAYKNVSHVVYLVKGLSFPTKDSVLK